MMLAGDDRWIFVCRRNGRAPADRCHRKTGDFARPAGRRSSRRRHNAGIEHGQRALGKKLAGGVGQAGAQQRIGRQDGGVVDAEPADFDAVGKDRNHRRFLAGKADVGNVYSKNSPIFAPEAAGRTEARGFIGAEWHPSCD